MTMHGAPAEPPRRCRCRRSTPMPGGRRACRTRLRAALPRTVAAWPAARRGRRTRLCAAARTLATSRSRLARISLSWFRSGLGMKSNGAQLQGLQGDVGSFLCQGADHDHRRLVHGQERRQCLQTRDLRHLDVERDHVGLEPRRLKHRLAAIARRAHDLDLRRRAAAGPSAAGASAPNRPRSGRGRTWLGSRSGLCSRLLVGVATVGLVEGIQIRDFRQA